MLLRKSISKYLKFPQRDDGNVRSGCGRDEEHLRNLLAPPLPRVRAGRSSSDGGCAVVHVLLRRQRLHPLPPR